MSTQNHEINVYVRKDEKEGKWVIRVSGVTSGARIHGNGDELSIEFKLDASRFTPVITKGASR